MLRLHRADVWHVGDNLTTDIAGAHAAGIAGVWLNRERRRRAPSDPRPDLEISSLDDLAVDL